AFCPNSHCDFGSDRLDEVIDHLESQEGWPVEEIADWLDTIRSPSRIVRYQIETTGRELTVRLPGHIDPTDDEHFTLIVRGEAAAAAAEQMMNNDPEIVSYTEVEGEDN